MAKVEAIENLKTTVTGGRFSYFPNFRGNLIKTRDDITFTIISNVSEGKLNKTWNLILIVLSREKESEGKEEIGTNN